MKRTDLELWAAMAKNAVAMRVSDHVVTTTVNYLKRGFDLHIQRPGRKGWVNIRISMKGGVPRLVDLSWRVKAPNLWALPEILTLIRRAR